MFLSELTIENFRLFGAHDENKHLSVEFRPGLNLLIGPNDAGKTCVIDAIRLLVGTATADYFPVTEDDFHVANGSRTKTLNIVGKFRGLQIDESGALLEFLSTETVGGNEAFYLQLQMTATLDTSTNLPARKKRVRVEVRAGNDEDGIRFDSRAKEMLSATYLKPLRDAMYELAARKGSRLSQILRAYPLVAGHENSDWDASTPETEPRTLVGIISKANHHLRQTDVITEAELILNSSYLAEFSIGATPLQGKIEPAAQDLRQVLERMELSLSDSDVAKTRGLGIYNLLFMATELLALSPSDEPDLPLLLIEEPEAHLHPQLQTRLIRFIRARSKITEGCSREKMQVIATSHSAHFAAQVPLDHVTIVNDGRAHSLHPSQTLLDRSDYEFLSRFLDVTKANLFFACGVIIVEGDAEALLMPVLAAQIGRPLDRFAVSIVNVGHVGLFRYSRIFQRRTGTPLPVNVSCIADRDIPPGIAKSHVAATRKTEPDVSQQYIAARLASRTRYDAQNVKTFVSPRWTLEYDLALSGVRRYLLAAVCLAKKSKSLGEFPTGNAYARCLRIAVLLEKRWLARGDTDEQIALSIYLPLLKEKASKAEAAQALARLLSQKTNRNIEGLLPQYLVDAIKHVTGG